MRKLINILGIATVILAMIGCGIAVKQSQLYIPVFNPNDTAFYTSSEIYTGFITSEAWATSAEKCISADATREAAYKGDLGLHIKWNKTQEGCPWLGIGFGWDNWTGKDLSKIQNNGAIQFWVRMAEGERAMLPWAIGLEDFSGAGAWLGMSGRALKAEKVTTEWSRVVLPLSEFNWEEQDCDVSNIKQIIFQLEADGEVFMDEIKIVPYSGGYRNRANLTTLNEDEFNVDGALGDAIWNTDELAFGNNKVHMAVMGKYLCVAAQVKDANPLTNKYEGQKVWDGDCFELAFSTDPEAPQKRGNYLSTDQHIGIAIRKELYAWDWQDERQLKKTKMAVTQTDEGYIFEAKLDLSELDVDPFEIGEIYGLEIAVDHGNEKGRDIQERWNEPSTAGFHENPTLWGEMYILPPSQANR
ncbi:MAG: hypothetical protein N4A46_04135 [Schleiferiaceae bacterium]|nr:hypothetical protein [Schleiferiaceae bacterium]